MRDDELFSLAKEGWLLISIAAPAVTVQFCVMFIFPQTASTVGRELGTEQLAGFSLASLTGNLTILSVMVGALTAADTLMPRAFGAGSYEEVGRLAIRGVAMCTVLLLPPIIPLLTTMDWIFNQLGQDPIASKLASQWIRVYLLGVPAMLAFRVVQSFLNAQHVVMPLMTASVASCFLVHPFLLHWIVPSMGFVGSGVAVSITQTIMTMIVFLYLYIKPEHHPQTWPAISRKFLVESLQPQPVALFLKLSLGGVLSLSEWWFWEVNCFIVGSLALFHFVSIPSPTTWFPSIHDSPRYLNWLDCTHGNSPGDRRPRAKKVATWCMGFTILVGAIVSCSLYVASSHCLAFTSDPKVLQGCEEIWPKLCVYIFILHIFPSTPQYYAHWECSGI
ncbi:MatE-like protein [Fragilaria crotonensis]|nr:MatE-like protein [Fragilaria crotonensis]